MTRFTGVMCALLIDDTLLARAMVDFKIPRSVVEFQQGGEESNYFVPGGMNVTGTIKRAMENERLLARVLGDADTSGGTTELHSGLTAPGLGGENVTDMENTDAGTRRIKLTALTEQITHQGRVVLMGTNVNDKYDQETVEIPLLGVNESVQGRKIFKTLTHVASLDYASAGKLKVQSIGGTNTTLVGRPPLFTLESIASNDEYGISITAPHCFLTKGSFSYSDANSGLFDEVDFQMQNPQEIVLVGAEGEINPL